MSDNSVQCDKEKNLEGKFIYSSSVSKQLPKETSVVRCGDKVCLYSAYFSFYSNINNDDDNNNNRHEKTWDYNELIIIMQKRSAHIKGKNNLFKPCKWHCVFGQNNCIQSKQ